MNFDFASLERRVAALEAAGAASLRFGRVCGIEGGKARVRLRDGQNVVSGPLSTIQARVLRDQDIKMPDIDEPVACLFSGNGHEEGIVLGAYYNGTEQAPSQAPAIDYHRYADGTELWYDRENHKLVAKVQGDAELETKGNVSARVQGFIVAESTVSIELKAPQIRLAGLLSVTDKDGKPGEGTLHGNYAILDGGLSVPNNDVQAGGISLKEHTHTGVESGSGTTGEPVGG